MKEAPHESSLTELVHRSYAVLVEEGLDPWIEKVAAPEFVWDVTPMGLGTYPSHESFREFFEDWVGSYEEWSTEVEVVEEISDRVVVTQVIQSGRLRGTRQPIELRYGQLAVWEGDRVARIVNFPDIEQARRRGGAGRRGLAGLRHCSVCSARG